MLGPVDPRPMQIPVPGQSHHQALEYPGLGSSNHLVPEYHNPGQSDDLVLEHPILNPPAHLVPEHSIAGPSDNLVLEHAIPDPPDHPVLGYPVPASPILAEASSSKEHLQPSMPENPEAWMESWLNFPPDSPSANLQPDYSELPDYLNKFDMINTVSSGISEEEITDPTLIEALQSDNYMAFDLWLAQAVNPISQKRKSEWTFE